ncbi:MAG TPA: AAA family ATPase [Burkholderiaceae bacterium]|nr:AAA family ATPase [Burkholderiaceae bacterium]
MYASFFGLKQEPFSIAPDPRYLFMSDRHREALAHLLWGLRGGGGFVLLSGEIGAGKTTVCRCFLEQIPPRCNVAYIFNPKLTVIELLQTVCDEFRIACEPRIPGVPTVKDYVDALNDFLLRTHALGRNNVLIIDEAQNLSADVLEQLRLLTNLETNERKLLQIILIGQPELRRMLTHPQLEQLAQRVIARFHLRALSPAEIEAYIRHRLGVAGLSGPIPFDRPALERIAQLSRGVPRRINLLADRALLGAYATGKTRVGRSVVDKAAQEVYGRLPTERSVQKSGQPRRVAIWAGTAVAAVALLVAVSLTLDVPRLLHPQAAVAAIGAVLANAAAPTSAGRKAADAVPVASAAGASEAHGVPATVAVLAELDDGALISSERQAWRELAEVWTFNPGEGDPCAAAQRQQVNCFRSNASSLALIRQLDRPGILTLRDGEGKPAYALLVGLDDHSATLRAGSTSQTIGLSALADRWRGEFATFWRAPSQASVAAQLAQVDGRSDTARANDPTLMARLSAFQALHGLRPDGLMGPATQMQLNRALGVDEPRLKAQR